MKVPFFDLKRIFDEQSSEIKEAVNTVFESGWYILGDQCAQFEIEIARSLGGAGSFVGCNSGTDAIALSLIACGIGAGDEVVTVSHTAIPTISAIVSVGATPVFVDVDAKTWLMNVDALKDAITPRTRAVVAVHLYGAMTDIPAIRQVLSSLKRDDISVIEDVAQAHGSSWNGMQAGTQGRFGTFSFYPTKNIGALGDGGGIFCRDEPDTDSLRKLRFYGQSSRYNAQVSRGINSRLDEIQAAILRLRLPKLAQWNQKKKEMVRRYQERLQGLPLHFQSVQNGCEPSWHLAVVRVDSNAVRDRLMQHLEGDGIQTMIHYPIPTHLQPAFRNLSRSALPETERLAGEILSLPMNPGVLPEEQSHVIESIKQFFR